MWRAAQRLSRFGFASERRPLRLVPPNGMQRDAEMPRFIGSCVPRATAADGNQTATVMPSHICFANQGLMPLVCVLRSVARGDTPARAVGVRLGGATDSPPVPAIACSRMSVAGFLFLPRGAHAPATGAIHARTELREWRAEIAEKSVTCAAGLALAIASPRIGKADVKMKVPPIKAAAEIETDRDLQGHCP